VADEPARLWCPKIPYDTERDARVALVDAIIRKNMGRNQRKECRVYECPTCHRWHLTSQRLP
jgi:hypothetical protein